MNYIRKISLLVIAIIIVSSCKNISNANSINTVEDFHQWESRFKNKAKLAGITSETLNKFSDNLEYLPRVIKFDRTQPDKTKTFQKYIKSILTPQRIQDAKTAYIQNYSLLNQISQQYSIDPSVIIALIAIESNFGKITGKFNILNSLATLSYEGRRKEFFENELIYALKIVQQEQIDPKNLKGSWAGAMGQIQFMPSSFINFAVDYNNDNHRDIWFSNADIFASVANYLKQAGWNNNLYWGIKVKIPHNFDNKLINLSVKKSLQSWQELGIIRADKSNKLLFNSLEQLSLIKPTGFVNYGYLVSDNYRVIMKWNRSTYFATTVFMLADSIRKTSKP